MILLKFSLINKWSENPNNLYIMKNFILLIHQLFHLTSFSLSLRPLLTASLYWFSKLNWFEQRKAKVAQSCPTLWDPIDYTVHGILQARILEWVAVPFSRGPSQPRDRTQVSCIVGGFFTQVSCIAGGFFTSWAIREAPFWTEKLQFSSLWLWLICMLLFSQKNRIRLHMFSKVWF